MDVHKLQKNQLTLPDKWTARPCARIFLSFCSFKLHLMPVRFPGFIKFYGPWKTGKKCKIGAVKQIWRIIVATKSLWRYYTAISTFTVLLAGLNLLMPFLTGRAIDQITRGSEADIGALVGIVVLIFLSDLGANLFGNISGYWGDKMAAQVQRILSVNYYQHILSLPQKYFDHELTGKIYNRLYRSVYQIASFMNVLSNNFLQFVFSTIFALVIVAIYSWQVALMFFALYPIFGYLTVKSSPKWRDFQHKKNEALDVSSGRFAEAINEIRVVKSFNQAPREIKFFRGYLNRFVDLTTPQSRYWHNWDTWRRLALNLIFLVIYLYIFVQAAHGSLSAGDAVALILYGMQIRIPLFTISFLVGQVQRATSDSREYFAAMDEKPEFADKPAAGPLKISQAAVEFEKVDFSYEAGEPVLVDINFKLAPGSKTALVGESGEGKTTIVNLLLRLYEVAGGKITIDGQNISDVTQFSLHESVGVVFQDPALFSGTIRENIGYANAKARDEQIISAAKAANAHEFIEKFEKGYDTEIGERGIKLSGGQKQRIAIARALLKDAPILVLDEATSSLDSRSEVLVQRALAHLMKNRTTLIIAHRLSTIANVDTVITLKNGRVDEIGSPKKLAKSGGIYDQLLKLQSEGTTKARDELEQFTIEE